MSVVGNVVDRRGKSHAEKVPLIAEAREDAIIDLRYRFATPELSEPRGQVGRVSKVGHRIFSPFRQVPPWHF